MSGALPLAVSERWQPLRAGLVDVFYYDQEEFWFRDGRLLLRGNNGTGKSKVLALMLPFLLDGELAPHRVEPDADPKKRMEWNLLLGGEHPNAERLGYTWLELGRLQDDGTPAYCTLGCGLKAVSGRGIASHWFFVTAQRVGAQLALADGAGIALTRERLEDAIATEGAVHRTATAYRRAVDETLFGLGERRYGALVDLLIRIRAPQLSKRPNERALSDALTEALAPLDQALIADVAEAFRSLEEDRDALAAMIEARDAATTYLRTYRRYAQIACRRRAARPRQAQTVYDRVSRARAEAQAAHERAAAELEGAQRTLAGLRAAETLLRARERALRESPEARSARELEGAQREARMASEHAAEAGEQHRLSTTHVEQLRMQETDIAARHDEASAALRAVRATSGGGAATALVLAEYDERVDGAIGARTIGELRESAAKLLDRQAQAVAHVRRLLDELEASQRRAAHARERVDELAAEQDAIATRREHVASQLGAAGSCYVRDARAHLAAAATLALADPAAVVAALELWVETLDGPNPLRAAVDAAGRATATTLAHSQARAQARRTEAQTLAADLATEIERLKAGEHDAPPVPHTRSADARDQRAGAPFWQLVDFHDGLAPEQRSGVEAALEAAGILDAWVTSDGQLLAVDSDDVVIDPSGGSGPSGEHLGGALFPAIDRDDPRAGTVSEAAVQGLLEAIGLGVDSGRTWVAASGRFRNGVLHGRWRKPAAAFIGHGAREAASRARLAELRARLGEHHEELEAVAREQQRIRDAQAALDDELAETPGDESLRDHHAALIALGGEQQRCGERVASARERLKAATAAAGAAEQVAIDGADELRLPVDGDELRAVSQGLAALRTALAELWPSIAEHERAAAAMQRAGEDRQRAEAEAAAHAERAAVRRHEAAQLTERHRVLADTVGAAVAELQARLVGVDEELRSNEREVRHADQRREDAGREEGREAGRLEQLAAELQAADEQRREDVAALRRFAATGLVAVALPDMQPPRADDEWTVTSALRVARQIEQELSAVDDDEPAWTRAQRRATDELGVLADALRRHGNNASQRLQEEGIVVEVVFRGRSTTVPALAAALAVEVEDRERLLSEHEREILENHLVNEVASSLQELISAAEAQVLVMNDELADRPTSTGMRLRMLWQAAPDGPQGLATARERLLRQHADAWSEDERAAVGSFLQAQIQAVRARDDGGTWLEHLTQALDYRAWHRFTIQRHQAGQWRSATGPASGGERVLAASVPLFAAASSHYASAGNPHAPRLVMLDEAFAGVDDDSRAKCLGLLTAFDLDVVMTSEREWGCYPEVPGLAIAQLSRVDGVAAVLVTHWEWDGAARLSVERPRAAAPPRPQIAAAGALGGQEDLWVAPTTSD
jgi:uncharacterized protein (TIGR02680 family)